GQQLSTETRTGLRGFEGRFCRSLNERFSISTKTHRESGKPNWLEKAMRFVISRPARAQGTIVDQFVVIDDKENTVQFDRDGMPANYFIISDDGRFCATSIDLGADGTIVEGWRLPRQKPWLWIAGIPASLGIAVFLWRLRSYRKQRRDQGKRVLTA